jgi:hypothetical protein
MTHIAAAALAALLLVQRGGGPPSAVSTSFTLAAGANIAGLAKLSLSASAIAFPSADPDVVPVIPASPLAITITAKARTTPGGAITLTVEASDVLRSGTDTIPIDALQWTGSGPGFVAGTMSATNAQPLGSWINSGARSGTQAYRLQNSWTRATGTYTTTLIYTLTAQ